jgi:cyclic dehypoxanthinyl futalosine synthase
LDLKNNSLVQDLVNKSDVSDILNAVLDGQSLTLNECIRLIRSEDVYAIGLIGNILRQRLYGNTVTFVNNIILNYTNVCITYCKFCAFYRKPGDKEAYTVPLEEILRRVGTSREIFGITQVLIQGGHNPNLGIEYYEDAFNAIKLKYPEIGIHGLSASEIDMIAKVERSSTKEVLARLKAAGLDSLPGAGAEILDDNVKAEISPLKIKSDEWLRIMEESHNLGLQSSATMMYGTVES